MPGGKATWIERERERERLFLLFPPLLIHRWRLSYSKYCALHVSSKSGRLAASSARTYIMYCDSFWSCVWARNVVSLNFPIQEFWAIDMMMMNEEKKKSSQLVCVVCCAEASDHFHYGAICCFSCRAFFRRYSCRWDSLRCVRDKKGINGPQTDLEDCIVNETTRNDCMRCRLKKCFDGGMKKVIKNFCNLN